MRLRELSIIQYQNVTEFYYDHRLWLSIDAFDRQLDYLSHNDFSIITMDEAIDHMERKRRENRRRPIALTFDNGYLDFYKFVYPRVLDHSLPCTVLISPRKVGKRVQAGKGVVNYLSWDNLREFINNNINITIGAYEDHDLNLNHVPEDLLQRHVTDFKKELEDKLGTEVRYFGVKEGVPNGKIRDLLISVGYRAFLTQCPTNKRSDLYSIGRIQVDDNDFNIFLTKVSRTYLFFKDKRSWKYIRKYRLDRVVHRISETLNKIRGIQADML